MKASSLKNKLIILVFIALAGGIGWQVFDRLDADKQKKKKGAGNTAIPVEVASIETGPLELIRSFTGTLKANAEFLVAPKISGRIDKIHVDLADKVAQGQVVAELDDAEHQQDVAQAEAELLVARANKAEADNLLGLANRELKRIDELRKRGVSSESQQDEASAEKLVKQALVNVTRAKVTKAEAELEAARIRLDYTKIRAGWQSGSKQREVAERFVDEGETVSANTPLLRIVELDPITAVFYVTERDYALLEKGQTARLITDAYPGESFEGKILRIAPVFLETTRQARVELEVANPELRLKPGMFIRAQVILGKADDAHIVPEMALATRDGQKGVFLVSPEGESVSWKSVKTGIQQGERIQLLGDPIKGEVVILGHQMLKDGSQINIAR